MNLKYMANKVFGELDENKSKEIDLDSIISELDSKKVSKKTSKVIVESEEVSEYLPEGYLGEFSYVPNPLESGRTAEYRNLTEGKVYRKNQENLWEVYLKDGKVGQTGPRGFAGGSGVGVDEVKRIISSYLNITVDTSGTIHSTYPIIAPNFTFSPTYISGAPQTASMQISAGTSQRVTIPSGTYVRLTWTGFGPFAYRQGDSSVSAISSDSIGLVGYQVIVPVIAPYLAVYGIGSGTVYLEGGN